MNIVKIGLIIIPFVIQFILMRSVDKMNPNIDKKRAAKILIQTLILYIPTTLIIYFLFTQIPIVHDLVIDKEAAFYNIYVVYLLSCSIAVLVDCPIAIMLDKYIEKKKIKRKEAETSYDKFDYYRELIDKIPPAMLAYIYDSNTKVEDEISATLINLEHRGKIELEDNIIKSIINEDGLKLHEKYIIETMTNKNRIEISVMNKEFIKKLRQDILNDKLGVVSQKEEIDLTAIIRSISGWLFLSQLVLFMFLAAYSTLGAIVFASYFISFIPLIICDKMQELLRPIIRTPKAIEIKVKLEGLHKFLTDFTNVNDRSIEEIKLYDEYILYTIIFDIKGNLDVESKEINTSVKEYKRKRLRLCKPTVGVGTFIYELFFLAVTYFAAEAGAVQMIKEGEGIGLILLIQIFPLVFTALIISQITTKE